MSKDERADAVRMGLALVVAVEVVIRIRRAASDDEKRDAAMGAAMGVLHGCCGPNGDFSSIPRLQTRKS